MNISHAFANNIGASAEIIYGAKINIKYRHNLSLTRTSSSDFIIFFILARGSFYYLNSSIICSPVFADFFPFASNPLVGMEFISSFIS